MPLAIGQIMPLFIQGLLKILLASLRKPWLNFGRSQRVSLLNRSVFLKFMIYVEAGTSDLLGNLQWLLRRRGRSSRSDWSKTHVLSV